MVLGFWADPLQMCTPCDVCVYCEINSVNCPKCTSNSTLLQNALINVFWCAALRSQQHRRDHLHRSIRRDEPALLVRRAKWTSLARAACNVLHKGVTFSPRGGTPFPERAARKLPQSSPVRTKWTSLARAACNVAGVPVGSGFFTVRYQCVTQCVTSALPSALPQCVTSISI